MNELRFKRNPLLMKVHLSIGWMSVDLLMGMLALYCACLLTPYQNVVGEDFFYIKISFIYGITVMLASLVNSVPSPEKEHEVSVYGLLSAISVAIVVSYLLIVLFLYLSYNLVLGRIVSVSCIVISFLTLLLPRLALMHMLAELPYRIAIYGMRDRGQMLFKKLRELSRFEVVGYCDHRERKKVEGIADLGDIVRDGIGPLLDVGAELVVVCCEDKFSKTHEQFLLQLPLYGVEVLTVGAFEEMYFKKISLEYTNFHWHASSTSIDQYIKVKYAKRLMDILFSLIGLTLTLPFYPLIIAAIKIFSPGPVFFSQIRMGYRREEFLIYKFRTMTVDAEKNGAQWATKHDSRVTRIGRFLRRTRLDEIPQLWNVLKGDMSLVGPRPERPEMSDELIEDIPLFEKRCLVPPGVTGWAQIMYRYGSTKEDAKRKLEYDLYYIKHLSLKNDLQILFKTIPMMMKGSQ